MDAMSTQLFRHEVIEAKRNRLTGTVIAATPPRASTYTAILALTVLAFILFAIFGQFATRSKVTGVLVYDQGFARIYPPQIAQIRKIHVHEGDVVEAGAPLVTISLSQGRDANGEGMAGQLAELRRQDLELARQQRLASMLGSGEGDSLIQQRNSLQDVIASLKRQRALAAAQVKIARSDRARTARLVKDHAASKRQLELAEATVMSRITDQEALEERFLSQRQSLRGVEAQIRQRHMTTQQTLSQIGSQRAALAAQRAAIARQDRLVLTAPISGRVTDLVSEIGQRARPEVSLVTIVPTGSTLEAQLFSPTRAVGFVKPGDDVRLLFDALPFQKYGAGHGTIIDISNVPADPSSIDPSLKIDQPVFRIRLHIDRTPSIRQGEDRPLRPGMTVSANLVLEQRALWEVFFAPVLKAIRA
jgi:membrane fusion protein